MIMFYHFYARWTLPLAPVNYYPYGAEMQPYFRHGFFGVEFFFIISGFVIFYTLEKSTSLGDFWVKRFSRLLPAMLVCSVLTYVLIKVFDVQNHLPYLHSQTALDFFPSLTFTHPIFWVKIFHNDAIRNINGSYWSLWVEVTFYLLSSIVFFLNRGKFIRNWFWLLVPLTILKIISIQSHSLAEAVPGLAPVISALWRITVYFNLCNYAAYFSLGILFYSLFSNKRVPLAAIILCALSTIVEMYYLEDNSLRVMVLAMIAVFLLFIYKPKFLAFLNSGFITRIGVISYSLYLIHENIGVLFINKFAAVVSSPVLVKIFPVVLMLLMIIFAEILYRIYEKPVINFLRKKLLSRATKKKSDALQPD